MRDPRESADTPPGPRQFRKRSVVVEAMRFEAGTGNACAAWCGGAPGMDTTDFGPSPWLKIPTLEGVMRANPGDWIIKGVAGEFYPCKPDIFAQTYEPASVGGAREGQRVAADREGIIQQAMAHLLTPGTTPELVRWTLECALDSIVAQRDAELAEARRAMRLALEQWRKPDEGYSAYFERQAERFYRATGLMAPGKSQPLEMASCDNDDERQAAWTAFFNAPYEAMRKAVGE